jgi:predicted P-loop ATPase
MSEIKNPASGGTLDGADSEIAGRDDGMNNTANTAIQTPTPDDPAAWEKRLRTDKKGEPRPLLINAALALREAPAWVGVLAYNDFAKRTESMSPPPWDLFTSTWSQRPWTAHDDLQANEWLQQHGISLSLNVAEIAVELVASECRFHPVLDYLDGLKWDGEPRLDNWMSDYLGVAPSDYIRAVARCSLIGAVARVRDPGCKLDNMPIFEGVQGIGKSSMAQAMFEPWYTDEIAEFGTKDAAEQMQGVWMIEVSELDAMSRGEVSKVKAHISRRVDRYRPSYGRRVGEYPRQCVNWGSTNSSGYLKDETGGRRFWPVECSKLKVPELRKVRDQLWAEAGSLYAAGVAWWFVNPNVAKVAEEVQAGRYADDVWTDQVMEFIAPLHTTTVAAILLDGLTVPTERQGQTEQNRVSRILRANGWERFQERKEGARSWRYRKMGSPTPATGKATVF